MEEFINTWTSDDNGWKRLKNYNNISIELEKELKKTVEKDNYTLYRGIYLTEEYGSELLYHMGLTYPQIGTFNLVLKDLTSWTLNRDEAQDFADIVGYTGLVLKTEVSSKHVLADLTVFNNWEQEVILKPGKYKIEIIEIVNEHYLYRENSIS